MVFSRWFLPFAFAVYVVAAVAAAVTTHYLGNWAGYAVLAGFVLVCIVIVGWQSDMRIKPRGYIRTRDTRTSGLRR